jgi:molecular chaperone DnaK
MTKLVERNTTIPVRRSEKFSTAEDNQTAVDIHILQGERELARDNRTLGNFRLEGIRPAQRNLPQIEVAFDIDANGILKVTASDKDTGKAQEITISGSTQLSREEIDRMVMDAKGHAEDDRRRHEEIEARNAANSVAYQAERQVKDLDGNVPVNEKARAEQLIADIQKLTKDESSDIARLRQLTGDLQQLVSGLESASHGATAAGNAQSTTPPPSGDDVIDAEFRPSK